MYIAGQSLAFTYLAIIVGRVIPGASVYRLTRGLSNKTQGC